MESYKIIGENDFLQLYLISNIYDFFYKA